MMKSTTYYDSFLTLKDTISIFTDFSSLKVNFEKSEVAWIGSKKFSDAPVDGVKWINLTKEVVRILGIYFTYNKSLSNEYNFTRVKENIKVVLNIWNSRSLSIMGKNTIIKNLVLPKVSCNIISDRTKRICERSPRTVDKILMAWWQIKNKI